MRDHVERYHERVAISHIDGALPLNLAEVLALEEVGAMYASFTGTRSGCTPQQRATLQRVLASPRLRIVRLTHGGAEGADDQAHAIARELGIEVWVRPSREATWPGAAKVFPMQPPLERNPLIVQDGHGLLVACPAEAEEQQRGGTWHTVRAARELNVDVLLILPDGTTRSERNRPPEARS